MCIRDRMATVATGIPPGICTIEWRESTPDSARLFTGTPITGSMVAALTTLPVIGVPVKSRALSGVDSLHSIVQMPGGIPVATVAIGGGLNAGLLAAQILSVANAGLAQKLEGYRSSLHDAVVAKDARLVDLGSTDYLSQMDS